MDDDVLPLHWLKSGMSGILGEIQGEYYLLSFLPLQVETIIFEKNGRVASVRAFIHYWRGSNVSCSTMDGHASQRQKCVHHRRGELYKYCS